MIIRSWFGVATLIGPMSCSLLVLAGCVSSPSVSDLEQLGPPHLSASAPNVVDGRTQFTERFCAEFAPALQRTETNVQNMPPSDQCEDWLLYSTVPNAGTTNLGATKLATTKPGATGAAAASVVSGNPNSEDSLERTNFTGGQHRSSVSVLGPPPVDQVVSSVADTPLPFSAMDLSGLRVILVPGAFNDCIPISGKPFFSGPHGS